MLLLTEEDINSIQERLLVIKNEGHAYFAKASPDRVSDDITSSFHEYWEIKDPTTSQRCYTLRHDIKKLSVDIAAAARGSPLLSEADMQELRHNTRQMLACLYFRKYQHTGVYVHHDEGVVLGVDPPTHEEVPFDNIALAGRQFAQAVEKTLDITDLLLPADTTKPTQQGEANYRPNTAFIMMAIDDSKPELEDVKGVIKRAFDEFGIKAITADEIEHGEVITDRILDEIKSSEFLIADLTYERPNVYYEVGHADAHKKRVILVRSKGTKMHFDLAHRNCPEYENLTKLRDLLHRRLEALTNKPITK